MGLVLVFKLISAESDSDAIPVFEKCSEYHTNILEELDVGTLIFQVAASVATNDPLEYSLKFNDKFKIDANTGKITTNYKFDRDEPKNEKEESVTVCARNKNKPKLIGTCEITVYIHDINDNAPIFQHPHYNQDFLINSKAKDVIFRVKATDIDAGENSLIVYSTDSHLFSIDDSGKIMLEKVITHTLGDVYNVTLSARNPNNIKNFTVSIISFKVITEESPTAATNDYKTTKMSINTLSVFKTTTEADNVSGDSMNETITNDETITNMKKTIISFLVKDYNSLAIVIMIIVMIINIIVCLCCCFSRRKRDSHVFASMDNSIYFFDPNTEVGESFNMIETNSMNNIGNFI